MSKQKSKLKPPTVKTITVHISGGFVSRTFYRAIQEKAEHEKVGPISEWQALGHLTALFETGEIECINPDQPDSPPIYQMNGPVTIEL